MKRTIMHPDYWVEIPAGECITGMSDEQREGIWLHLLRQVNYDQRSPQEKVLMEQAIESLRQGKYPTQEQIEVFGAKNHFAILRAGLSITPPMQVVHVNRFYIARFPIIRLQTTEYRNGVSAATLPGVFEDAVALYSERMDKLFFQRVPSTEVDIGLDIAQELGARMPTHEEWEKAARGTDGRLYPWGNEWDASRGHFYPRQDNTRTVNVPGYGDVIDDQLRSVDAFPQGQSPYGVWAMTGGLPEIAGNTKERKTFDPSTKTYYRGHHPGKTSAEVAFIDHLIANHGLSIDRVPISLRMVLDNWSRQQWTGIDLES